MTEKRAIVFANGDLLDPFRLKAMIGKDDLLVAADGGYHNLHKLSLKPDLVIGDLDSLEARAITTLKKQNIAFIQHPVEKDQTDLELALIEVLKRDYRDVLIACATGSRLDQTLANIELLIKYSKDQQIRMTNGTEEVFVISHKAIIVGEPGDTVSLIPIDGIVSGITTNSLKYPLKNERLSPGSTRGISNEMLKNQATIRISSGRLLCIHLHKIGGIK